MTTEKTAPTAQAPAAVVAGAGAAVVTIPTDATVALQPLKTEAALLAAAVKDPATESKTPEQASADAAPKDGKADAVAPLEVKFKDGVKVDEKLATAFLAAAKEVGLDSVEAQKIADSYQGVLEQAQEQFVQADKSMRQKWADELKADKEFGGANLDATRAAAKKAAERFGGKELADFVATLGLIDHPALVKAFARAGKAISEDSIAGTTTSESGGGLSRSEKQLRSMYPTSPK